MKNFSITYTKISNSVDLLFPDEQVIVFQKIIFYLPKPFHRILQSELGSHLSQLTCGYEPYVYIFGHGLA
jgi:hypothetical protein